MALSVIVVYCLVLGWSAAVLGVGEDPLPAAIGPPLATSTPLDASLDASESAAGPSQTVSNC